MSGTKTAGSYSALFQRPAVARTFVLALIGRLAYGVLPLSLLFTVQHATGSFAQAAIAIAVNCLAALSMPLKSRAIDRFGQRMAIPLMTAVMVVVLLAGAALATLGSTTAAPWLALALAVGLASPPLGPSMRVQWRALVSDYAVVTAYSLDAVAEETLYLLGPILAAGLLAVAPAYSGLIVCGLLLSLGAAGLASSPVAARATRLDPQRTPRGPLRHRPYLGLLIVMTAVGAVTATISTSAAARALAVGHPSYAGPADASLAFGSVIGGLLWGRWGQGWTWRRSLAGLLAVLAGALVVASSLTSFWPFAAAVGMAGVTISPIYVVAYRASDALVEPTEVTEAGTWVNTATNLGISLGAAGSGLLASHGTARTPGWAGATLALGFAIALAARRPRR